MECAPMRRAPAGYGAPVSTWARARTRSGSCALARHPDLLRRPAPRPLDGDVGIRGGRARWWPQLDEILHLEGMPTQEPNPVPVAEVELDRLVVRPFEAMHPKVVAHEPLLCRNTLRVRHAQHENRAVDEEDELATGSEEAGSLGNPAVRVTPDAGPVFADGEVETGVGQRDLLGIAVDEREGKAELLLQRTGRLELFGRVVDAGDVGTAPGEPGGDVGGATAKFDGVTARDVGGGVDLGLGDAPDSPRGFFLPVAPPRSGIVPGPDIPGGAIAPDVLCQIAVRRHRSILAHEQTIVKRTSRDRFPPHPSCQEGH